MELCTWKEKTESSQCSSGRHDSLKVVSITKGYCSRCHVWHTHDPKTSMQCSKYSWVGDGGYPTRLSSFQQGCLQNRLVQMTEICSRISASHAESSGGLLGICGSTAAVEKWNNTTENWISRAYLRIFWPDRSRFKTPALGWWDSTECGDIRQSTAWSPLQTVSQECVCVAGGGGFARNTHKFMTGTLIQSLPKGTLWNCLSQNDRS